MAENTGIEWTDATWSPWEGCTKVSPGCDHCYAEGMNRWLRKGENWGPGAPRREYSVEHWAKPLHWNAKAAKEGRQLRVFPSVCDPFDNEVDPAWRARFFALIDQTPHLTWLLLTKRIGNVAKMIEAPGMQKAGLPPNVWLGATVVNQEEADRDVPKLLYTPARVRFLSIEPMLGPITLPDMFLKPLNWGEGPKAWPDGAGLIDWVIGGFESGPHARPGNPTWARSLRDQCSAARTAFLWKQNGEFASVSEVAGPGAHFTFPDGATVRRVGKKAAGRLLDGTQHDGFPEVIS